jgi:hypothetical protein
MDPRISTSMPQPAVSPDEMAARQRRHDERDGRLLVGLTVVSALTAALGLVLAFQVSQYNAGRHSNAAPAAPPAECTEGELPSRCQPGEICQDGLCVPPGAPSRCEPGALCGTCECEQPLACDAQNVCVLPRNRGVCDDAEVIKFLSVLKEKCGNARKCESKDLDKYAINYADFLNLMVQFPSTLAIHFPDGEPSPLATRRWPRAAESEHYINRIRSTGLEELKAADRVILVGLASRGRRVKDRDVNTAITLQRLIATQDLIRSAAASVLPPAEVDAIEEKISFIHLGDWRPIDARFYGKQYGNRPIAWDRGTEEHLMSLVEQGDVSGSPEDLRWRDRLINQVVFVVPIPCGRSGS